MGDRRRISVVICTRDRAEDLSACLRSIDRQSVAPEQVVVVIGSAESVCDDIDVCLTRASLEVVECFEHNISASRNAGLGKATGEIVVFIDDDAIARAGWLEAYRDAFEREPEAWAIGGDVFDARVSPMELEFSRGVISRCGRQRAVCDGDSQAMGSRWLPNVKGCNFAIDRERAMGVGGFDSFFAFAFDEADLMVTIGDAGGLVMHEPRAAVDHAHTPGHYRQASRLDRDWGVEYASHAMFVLKHARGVGRVRGMGVLIVRVCKLAAAVLVGVLVGKVRHRVGGRYVCDAVGGIARARRAFAAKG